MSGFSPLILIIKRGMYRIDVILTVHRR